MGRIYGNAYELVSEMFRDLSEMGTIVKPKSYQNQNIEGKEEFQTKELRNYVYSLTRLPDIENLFLYGGDHGWAQLEFVERVRVTMAEPINPGDAWKLRPEVWRKFLVDGKFDYTYNERLNWNQNLARVEAELVRNPDTRQAWLPIFFPSDVEFYGGKKRIPCSLGYYFMVRDGKLSLTYIQRSADAVTHLGNDIYLAFKMMEYMARRVGVEPDILTHHIFSLHAYKKDWKALAEGIYKLQSYESK